jgi:hypothetical protein
MIGPFPAKAVVVNEDNTISDDYANFLSEVFYGVVATQSSGPTSKRPTKRLFPGRYFFDTSLGARGKPIWIAADGSTWIDATGAVV